MRGAPFARHVFGTRRRGLREGRTTVWILCQAPACSQHWRTKKGLRSITRQHSARTKKRSPHPKARTRINTAKRKDNALIGLRSVPHTQEWKTVQAQRHRTASARNEPGLACSGSSVLCDRRARGQASSVGRRLVGLDSDSDDMTRRRLARKPAPENALVAAIGLHRRVSGVVWRDARGPARGVSLVYWLLSQSR